LKNIQNIIGWEKNFIFSNGGEFLVKGFSLEKRRVFQNNSPEINSPKAEKVDEKTKYKEKLQKDQKEKIEHLQEQLIKNEIKWPLIDLAKTYEDVKNTNLDFKWFLWSFFETQDWNILLNKPKKETDISNQIQELLLKNNSILTKKITSLKTKIAEKNTDEIKISMWYSEINNTEEQVKNSRETQWSTANKLIDVVKSIWQWNPLESSMWIIVTWFITALWFKKAPWFTAFIASILWWWYILNELTWWKLLSEIWDMKNKAAENLKLTDEQENVKNAYKVNVKQLWVITHLWTLSTTKFLEDTNNINDLKKAAKWEWENIDFKNKPEWFLNKNYAIVVLKLLAKNAGYNLYENEKSEEIKDWYLTKWIENYKNNWINEMKLNILVHSSPEWNSTLLSWAEQKIDNISKLAVKHLNNSWSLDYVKHNWLNIQEIFWASVFFEYKDWKIKIFSSKENTWSDNLVWEVVDWTIRMITWTVESIPLTFSPEHREETINSTYAINRINWIDSIWSNINEENNKNYQEWEWWNITAYWKNAKEYFKNNTSPRDLLPELWILLKEDNNIKITYEKNNWFKIEKWNKSFIIKKITKSWDEIRIWPDDKNLIKLDKDKILEKIK